MAEGIAPGQILLDPPMIDVSGRHAHVVLTPTGVDPLVSGPLVSGLLVSGLLVSGAVSEGKSGV